MPDLGTLWLILSYWADGSHTQTSVSLFLHSSTQKSPGASQQSWVSKASWTSQLLNDVPLNAECNSLAQSATMSMLGNLRIALSKQENSSLDKFCKCHENKVEQ